MPSVPGNQPPARPVRPDGPADRIVVHLKAAGVEWDWLAFSSWPLVIHKRVAGSLFDGNGRLPARRQKGRFFDSVARQGVRWQPTIPPPPPLV